MFLTLVPQLVVLLWEAVNCVKVGPSWQRPGTTNRPSKSLTCSWVPPPVSLGSSFHGYGFQLMIQPPQLWLQHTLYPPWTDPLYHAYPTWWTKTMSQRTLSSLGCYHWSCCSQQYRNHECNIPMKVISDFFALLLLGVNATANNPAQWIKVQLISSIASLWLLLSWLIQFVFWVKRLHPLHFIL